MGLRRSACRSGLHSLHVRDKYAAAPASITVTSCGLPRDQICSTLYQNGVGVTHDLTHPRDTINPEASRFLCFAHAETSRVVEHNVFLAQLSHLSAPVCVFFFLFVLF